MLKELYRRLREQLADGGIEDADAEARALLQHITGYDRAGLIAHGSDSVTAEQQTAIQSLAEKRLQRIPLQYLIGEWSFMGFPLYVGEGVLIPRDDTEVCVGLCLDYLQGKAHAKALDLCAGSGAIAIALNKLGKADVTAIELSDSAFYFLKKNIERNKAAVTAIKSDILTCFNDFEDNSVDLIASNPPYIKRADLSGLQAEVQYEPKMALDGGESGYDFYEAIIQNWSRKLKHGGALVFELGEGQAETVADMMTAKGFADIRTALDFGGCHRAIIGTMR